MDKQKYKIYSQYIDLHPPIRNHRIVYRWPLPDKLLRKVDYHNGNSFSETNKDLDRDDLSSGDMDDIMDLAKNRVLEFRLLKTAKDNPDRQLDLSGAVEKIRKENKTFKENLSTRRKDRIDPNEFKGFSIVDLAVAFDNNKKVELTEKALRNRKAEREAEEKRKDYTGNRYDIDVGTDGKKEDD